MARWNGDFVRDLRTPLADGSEPRVYALLDASRDPEIHPAVLATDRPWCCLYRGATARTLADAAPYLVELDPRARFTSWLLAKAWGRSWGVFVRSPADLAALRNHFRRLLMVRLPDDKVVYFRFYDPRVLRVYLPTCTPDELSFVFGPVESFELEAEEGVSAPVLAFHRKEDGTLSTTLTLYASGHPSWRSLTAVRTGRRRRLKVPRVTAGRRRWCRQRRRAPR